MLHRQVLNYRIRALAAETEVLGFAASRIGVAGNFDYITLGLIRFHSEFIKLLLRLR